METKLKWAQMYGDEEGPAYCAETRLGRLMVEEYACNLVTKDGLMTRWHIVFIPGGWHRDGGFPDGISAMLAAEADLKARAEELLRTL